jgi:hypothetical protein
VKQSVGSVCALGHTIMRCKALNTTRGTQLVQEERKAKKAAAAGGVADGEAPRKVMRSFKQRGRRDDGERATDSNEMDLGVLASVFGGK